MYTFFNIIRVAIILCKVNVMKNKLFLSLFIFYCFGLNSFLRFGADGETPEEIALTRIETAAREKATSLDLSGLGAE